eukprot:scaffold3581_cov99-Isochrysis_galbana.AAC.1
MPLASPLLFTAALLSRAAFPTPVPTGCGALTAASAVSAPRRTRPILLSDDGSAPGTKIAIRVKKPSVESAPPAAPASTGLADGATAGQPQLAAHPSSPAGTCTAQLPPGIPCSSHRLSPALRLKPPFPPALRHYGLYQGQGAHRHGATAARRPVRPSPLRDRRASISGHTVRQLHPAAGCSVGGRQPEPARPQRSDRPALHGRCRPCSGVCPPDPFRCRRQCKRQIQFGTHPHGSRVCECAVPACADYGGGGHGGAGRAGHCARCGGEARGVSARSVPQQDGGGE